MTYALEHRFGMQKLMEMEKYDDEADFDENDEFQDVSGSRRRQRRPRESYAKYFLFSLPNKDYQQRLDSELLWSYQATPTVQYQTEGKCGIASDNEKS